MEQLTKATEAFKKYQEYYNSIAKAATFAELDEIHVQGLKRFREATRELALCGRGLVQAVRERRNELSNESIKWVHNVVKSTQPKAIVEDAALEVEKPEVKKSAKKTVKKAKK